MKKYFLFALTVLSVSASLYADNYSDFKAYKSGDSLAWFYELNNEALVRSKSTEVESKLIEIISTEEISNGAFKSACEILKPIASKKSIPVLAKFLGDDFRTPWVCDVFIAFDCSKIDEILVEALANANEKCTMDIISTLAARGSSKGFEAVKKYVNSNNRELAVFAVYALGKFIGSDAIEILSEIADKNDFRRCATLETLSSIAYEAVKDGRKALARKALTSVPEDFAMAIVARAELAGEKRTQYLDSLIIKGICIEEAGRALSQTREFKDSASIIAAFPNLSRDAKLVAMGTFINTGDTRFYPIVAPLIDSTDTDLRDEAVYLARFICTDEPSLDKIYGLMSSENRILSGLAQNVIEENPSFAMSKLLNAKANAGDLKALEILVKRGDCEARKKLMKMYFAGEFKNSKVSQTVENTIAWGEMRDFASNLNGASLELQKDISKIIIKKLAKNGDMMFRAEAAYEILNGNVSPDDKNYKFICSKLNIKPTPRNDVWQSEFRQRAVADKEMKIATALEPDLKATKPIFDGKTLKGWKTSTGDAAFSVKDRCIVGEVTPRKKDKDGNVIPKSEQNSFLITERSDYKDFVFTCEFKWEVEGNSGVIFRGAFKNDRVVGPQAEIDPDGKRRWTGGIYDEGNKWKYSVSRADQGYARAALLPYEWNRLTVRCVDDKMQTWLNGVPVADLEWTGVDKGFFGLQVHVGRRGKILWRNIAVEEM